MHGPAKLFISYSYKDKKFVDAFQSHLDLLRRQGVVDAWHDRRIFAGEKEATEIDKNLRSSDIILLVVSADFIASDYCYGLEVKQALAMHDAGEAVVIPVIVRPCDWKSASFGRLQALPRDGRPVSSFKNTDETLLEMATEIRQIAESDKPSKDLPLTSTIEFRLNVDFDSFSTDDETRFIDAVQRVLGSEDTSVKIVTKRRGSVILKLKLRRAAIELLEAAAKKGELTDFSIVDAEVVREDEWLSSEPDQRPRVFVGSSTEGLNVAETIQLNLDQLCEVTVWHQGVFTPGSGTLQTLLKASREYDFAILVLTPDDMAASRGDTFTSPRDNVIFELGLFMGSLGAERTMVLYDRTSGIKIPSDLAGVTMITYQRHSTGDLEAALGASCTRLKKHITKHGLRNT
jgi:predicted nucleotide-binding protein